MKVFPLFRTILDVGKFLPSRSEAEKNSLFRQKKHYCLATPFQGYPLFICGQSLDYKIVLLQCIYYNVKQISSFVYVFNGEIYAN